MTVLPVCECVCTAETKTMSYHAVHRKMVVLGLQLDGMLVVPSDLCVTGEKKALVVHDPVEHLQNKSGNVLILKEYTPNEMVFVFTLEKKKGEGGLLFGVCNLAACLNSLSGMGAEKGVFFYSSDASHSRPLGLLGIFHFVTFLCSRHTTSHSY